MIKPISPMKSPNRQTVTKLTDLPNIGKAIAGDLSLVGIQKPQDLIGKNAYSLHDQLCRVTGTKHDPCVIDVFLAVIDFMEGGDPVPWWKFTAERKKHMARDHKE
jgi:hypothetical protein